MENYNHMKDEFEPLDKKDIRIILNIAMFFLSIIILGCCEYINDYRIAKIVIGLFVAFFSAQRCKIIAEEFSPYNSTFLMIFKAFSWVFFFLIATCSVFFSMTILFLEK